MASWNDSTRSTYDVYVCMKEPRAATHVTAVDLCQSDRCRHIEGRVGAANQDKKTAVRVGTAVMLSRRSVLDRLQTVAAFSCMFVKRRDLVDQHLSHGG
jgi:hypothetical protein